LGAEYSSDCPFSGSHSPSDLSITKACGTKLNDLLSVQEFPGSPNWKVLPRPAVNFLAHLSSVIVAAVALQPGHGAFTDQLALEFGGGHEDVE